MDPVQDRYELVLVGGGLANALVALAVLERRPGTKLALVERGERLGGEHTWCFHADDVPAEIESVVEPLVEHRWPGYFVRFPDSERRLDSPYAGFGSDRLDERVREVFARSEGARLLIGSEASNVAPHRVDLAGGKTLHADVVLDARGPRVAPTRGRAGYQIFVGHELELAAEHGLERPVVMDATVDQEGGYRFVYVLPFGPRRLLVEDTVFADGPELDEPLFERRLEAYAQAAGWRVARRLRSERGVLPMEFRGRGPVAPRPGLIETGYGGGWVHPATGYSFPVAGRVAAVAAACEQPARLHEALHPLWKSIASQSGFGRRLNRLLFRWFPPHGRRDVFARFYRLPEASIARFYALRMTVQDRFRILVGRPPRGMSLAARRTAARRLS